MKTQTLGRCDGFSFMGSGWLAAHVPPLVRFPQKALDELREHDAWREQLDEARDDYLANRKNGLEDDAPKRPFPQDGSYSWGTPESEEESKIRYSEGPRDRVWMQERDRKYVFRLEQENRLGEEEPNLETEVPKLYAEVMAKRQSRLTEEKMAQEAEARQAEQARAAQAAALKHEQDAKDKAQKAAEQQAKAAAEAKAKKNADAARARQQAGETTAAKQREQEAAQAKAVATARVEVGAKAKKEAEERARKEAELAAQQREQEAMRIKAEEKAKEIAKALLIGRKQLSKSKEGAHWKKDALKTFREILEKQPNHFEAWSRVVTLLTEANTPEEIREALKMIMSFEPSVLKSEQQNTGLYIAAVNQLTVRLLASGNVEMMRGALKMVALALSCFPDEASLTQGRQQIVDKLSTRALFLQNLGTLRSSDTGAPQHSPRTDYAYLTQAFALEENISTYTGEEGEANRAFLESELDKLGKKIKPLSEEGQEVAQQRALRLQQEQEAWEAAQQTLAAGPAAEAKPESERSVSSSERVRQWREANAAAVDPNERPFADEQDASDRDSDDDASIVTAQFRSTDANQIADELIKRIRREGHFIITFAEDEYIEIRCRPDKVEAVVAQTMKVTLSKLFNNIKYPDGQTIRLPWDQLSDKQVRKFEALFARHKQEALLRMLQDKGEDTGADVKAVLRRVKPS